MAFPPQFMEELKNRVGLAELVGRRTKLTKKGREYSGLCPFHNEKTPSFTVNEEKGFYHCFGCGANGDLIEFVKQTEGVSFPEAVERLAALAGLPMPVERPEEKARQQHAATLHDAMELAAKWFTAQLASQAGNGARQYLARRQVSENAVASFRLGFAPNSRTALKEALIARGVSEATLIEGGLIIKPDDGRDSYDRFRDRLMFPITDRRGRVIAFGGRALGDAPAKYLNSPETPLFHKGHVLYNMATARQKAFDTGSVIVAEGYMDVIALSEAGFPQSVAPLGTAITEDQLQVLWQMTPEPTLCLDGDAAGWRAALRASERALPLLRPGYSLRFALLPEGVDPDDLIRKEGPGAMGQILKSAEPLSEILWRKEVADRPVDTPERKAALEKALYGLCDQMRDPAVQNHYRAFFKERLWQAFRPKGQTSRQDLRGNGDRNRFGRFANQGSDSRFSRNPSSRMAVAPAVGRREELILLTVVNHPEIMENHYDTLASIQLASPQLDRLRRAIIDIATVESSLDYTDMAHHLAKRKLSEQVKGLQGPTTKSLDWFVDPGAAHEDALNAWLHIVARHKVEALQKDLEAAERQLGENATAENLDRLKMAKQALDAAAGNEVDIDGFGLASGRNKSV
ncbi:DNA primase [uncultured Sneathiella sp.]|uniref:DNA primase n=1 Tax=uncultured Sneathiella sp. TaxID=879315 RepID=UPI0030EE4F3A|tara:strand:- start:6128 stop:8017 length:1890 start_codon:yes stop_codon:yes gene_type:complete